MTHVANVPSERQPGTTYPVTRTDDGSIVCTCVAFDRSRAQPATCKHIVAYEFSRLLKGELDADAYRMLYKHISMARRKLMSFAIDPDLAAALKAVKERDHIPESQQIRLALRGWLKNRGVLKEAAPRRGAPRRKA